MGTGVPSNKRERINPASMPARVDRLNDKADKTNRRE
jgi:hypothetical protein